MLDYRNSHVQDDKGILYHDKFESYPWRAHLWSREKIILDKVVSAATTKNNYLDFACGTGRIIGYLEKYFKSSTGVDVSDSMLEVCRKRVRKSKIIKADITRMDILDNEKYDIVTAFRFFSNAQNSLRIEAMTAITELLEDNGILIFNNHKNTTNGFFLLAKLFKRKKVSMSKDDVHDLVIKCGMEIINIYPIGAIPAHEKLMIMPGWASSLIDRFVCSLGFGEILCQNIIYVCKKKSSDVSSRKK